jgi:hypothetical protein
MHETFTTFNLSEVLINAPKYAILIIVVPMLTLTVLKVWMTARASSTPKRKKEWVLSRQHDEEGIPLLAEATTRSQPGSSQQGRRTSRANGQKRQRP